MTLERLKEINEKYAEVVPTPNELWGMSKLILDAFKVMDGFPEGVRTNGMIEWLEKIKR